MLGDGQNFEDIEKGTMPFLESAQYPWCLAATDINRSESGLWHLRVAEGDRLSERSERRKLPQHKTRALAIPR